MSKQLVSIHDAFFKRALSDPERAGLFLREHLPTDVADLLGPEAPEPVPGSFVDEALRDHHSDLIFRVHLKAERDAFAYILMEHKSSPVPGARLQLLRYIVRLLSDWYAQNKQRLPLPLVLPLVTHHGPGGWGHSCEFADLFGTVPEPLRRYLPSFRHALVDLGKIDDDALSAQASLRTYLKAAKYILRSNLPDRLGIILADAGQVEEEHLKVILTYLDKGPIRVDIKLLRETLLRLVPDKKERIMGWLTQPYYDQGLVEGEARGKAEGEAKMFARLLEKRFGAIPSPLRERIFAADTSALEAWSERLFDARDLQSVFDSN